MSAGYRLVERARLEARNTFGVPATAPMLVEVADVAALPELFCPALRECAVGMVLFLGIALPRYVLVFWLLRERHTWVTCREW